MSNKIPSVSHLLFDIYTIYHTKKSLRTRSKIKKDLIKKYKLPEKMLHLNAWNYLYNSDMKFEDVSTDLIYEVLDFFIDFLNIFNLLEVDYDEKYNVETFNNDFFREKEDYTLYILSKAGLVVSNTKTHDKLLYTRCIQYIDYEYAEFNKLFGASLDKNTVISDDVLFSQIYRLDPFLAGLKEDLLKFVNFNVLNHSISKVEQLTEAVQIPIKLETEEPAVNIKEQLLQQVKQLDPTQFEQFSLYLLAIITKEKNEDSKNLITHNGQVGDGGVDGILKVKGALDSYDTYLIQCKRYNKTSIGSPELQAFVGAMRQYKRKHKVTKGIFITTSSFTKSALEFIEDVSHDYDIIIMDGEKLVDYMLEYKIGIMEEVKITVDIPFFKNFTL